MTPRRLVDPLAACIVLGMSVATLVDVPDPRGGLAPNLAYPVAIGALVLVRRRFPVGSGLAFVAISMLQATFLVLPSELAGAFLGLLIFPFTAGAHATGLRAAIVLAGVIGLYGAVELMRDGLVLNDAAFPIMLCTAAFLAGRGVHSRTRLAAELHEAAVAAEEAREAEAGRAIAAERRRIARELHDVVAHSISVMVVQAGGARRIMDRDVDRAVGAAEEIERSGREALAEMRRLLGVLQPVEGEHERSPQPGLRSLGELVSRMREAGLPVEVHVEGERRELATGLELAAYRIVQEALTNAVRHAGCAPTDVRLLWSPEALEIQVADRGPGTAATPGGGGHGIIGMRERVRLYGGELHAGRRRGGGFEVRARLPLESEEVPA